MKWIKYIWIANLHESLILGNDSNSENRNTPWADLPGLSGIPVIHSGPVRLPENLQLIAIHENFTWLWDLWICPNFLIPEIPKMNQNGLCLSFLVNIM